MREKLIKVFHNCFDDILNYELNETIEKWEVYDEHW